MAITDRYDGLPETQVHDLLRNERRQQVIKHLQRSVGKTTLYELAERIAEHETGESPPPRNIRNSVYNSLHQTHLPKLDERGIVEYDADRKTVTLTDRARTVDAYMAVVTPYGVTWSEYYRTLGTVALFVVLASLVGLPVLALVEPVLWTTLFLAAFALSVGYQVWNQRWRYLNTLLD